jgi:hypothetical protein
MDLSGLRGFASALRKASPGLAKELRAGLRHGAEIVRDDAIARAASADVPKSISPSIRVRTAGVRASVIAGNEKAPAAAFENKGFPGQFRHPLFGNRAYWYPQRAHPFLRPSAEANAARVADEITERVGEVIDKALGETA